MKQKQLIFVVAYEAEAHIPELFERIRQSGLEATHDILVIDDASGDKTAEVAKRLASGLSTKTTVLRNPSNLGYGGNQKLGYEYAIREGYEAVVLLHGDCQYPPEFIPEMTRPIVEGRADVVFGSRMLDKKSALRGGMPLYKWIGNQVTTAVQNFLLGAKFSECHTGFRAYRVPLLAKIPFRYNSNGFHFDADIIIQCHRAGARFLEIPIPTRYSTEICRVNGVQYCWNCFKSGLADRCTQMEIFYSRKFDLQQKPVYESKLGLTGSSHEVALRMVPEGSKVVDLGGGNGALARELKKKGCRVTVVDTQLDLQDEENITTVHASVEDLAQIPKAEVVLLMDVIEHIRRNEQFLLLEKIRVMGSTQPTKVIVSVPNSVFLPVRVMMMLGRINYGRRGILDETHAFLFTRHSLRSLLLSAGYKIGRVEYTSAPVAFAFPGLPRFSRFLSSLQLRLAHLLPGWFAYQIVAEAYPAATVSALLQAAEEARS
ncbi:MAG: glycosyltransferase [Chthoniobacterales bacterium]|nr:glycosyltransferase [Chthoniobacterales bacterium]